MATECEKIMTRDPVFQECNATIATVAKMMAEHDVGFIPIVENLGSMRLVGVVTTEDIVLKCVAYCRDPKTTPSHEIMIPDPVTCYPYDDIKYVFKLMKKCHIRRIPIINREKRLLGLISESDIAMHMQPQDKQTELLEASSVAGVRLEDLKEVDAM